MMHRRVILPALLGVMLLGTAACSSREPQVDLAAEEARIAAERAAAEAAEAARRAQEEAEAEARRRAEAEREAREAAERAAVAETARAREILGRMVHFDYDRYEIRGDAQEVLMQKIPILRANPQLRIRIEGHCDERGSVEYNLGLGERRANAVRTFLQGHGIAANRVEVVSFGKERPVDQRSNEDAWARNRRAEFHIIAGGDRISVPSGQ